MTPPLGHLSPTELGPPMDIGMGLMGKRRMMKPMEMVISMIMDLEYTIQD